MASIGFTNSSFTLKMDKAVKSVNFGFPGASNLVNLAPEPRHEITGHSYIAVVIYNVAGTSPRTFLAPPSSFAFGAGESITLTCRSNP